MSGNRINYIPDVMSDFDCEVVSRANRKRIKKGLIKDYKEFKHRSYDCQDEESWT